MQRQAVFQSNDPQELAKFLDVLPVPDSAIFSLDFASSWIAYGLNASLKFDVRPLVQYIVFEVVRHRHRFHAGHLTTPVRCRQLTGVHRTESRRWRYGDLKPFAARQAETKKPAEAGF
jgi:hypothetical protein